MRYSVPALFFPKKTTSMLFSYFDLNVVFAHKRVYSAPVQSKMAYVDGKINKRKLRNCAGEILLEIKHTQLSASTCAALQNQIIRSAVEP